MPAASPAEEVLGLIPDEESGATVVRARLACGCIVEKMVPRERIVAAPDGRVQLQGKLVCQLHPNGC